MMLKFMYIISAILSTDKNILSIHHSIASRYQTISHDTQNIYRATIKLPSDGYVNITYQRVGVFKYKIEMLGSIQATGVIYYDDKNNCAIDYRILRAIHHYRGSSCGPWHHNKLGSVETDILLYIITHIKRIFKYELYLFV